MNEPVDRAAIKARERLEEWLNSVLGDVHIYPADVREVLAALEGAERDLAGYGAHGALAYERAERMSNLHLKTAALKERNAWRHRAEAAERRIGAVEKALEEDRIPNEYGDDWIEADTLRSAFQPLGDGKYRVSGARVSPTTGKYLTNAALHPVAETTEEGGDDADQ